MRYLLLAHLLVVVHLAFVVFVVLGALLVLRRPRVAWVHVPAALWGVLIEFAGWTCPLTPLEKSLRDRGEAVGYPGGFIEHYLLPLLYPSGLTRGTQVVLGLFALTVNAAVYTWLWRRAVGARRSHPGAARS